MKQKMKITERTYKKNLFKFGKKQKLTMDNLFDTMDGLGLGDDQIEKLCEAIDAHTSVAIDMTRFCVKNNVSMDRFCEDINNKL